LNLVSDDPLQVENVKQLRELQQQQELNILTSISSPAEQGNRLSVANTEVNSLLSKIEQIEEGLLEQRTESLHSSERGSFLFNFLGAICAMFLASISAVKLLQHLKELKVAKKELEQKEEKLRVIYNSTSDALMLLDIESFNIIDCNKTTLQFFGEADKNAFIGLEFFAFGNQSSKKEEKDYIKALVQDSKFWTKEVVFKAKDDSTFWGEVCFSKTIVEDKERILVRITDVTKRKNVEKEVQETSKILNGILENLPVMVYRLDSIGTITMLKGKGIASVGLEEEAVIGQNVYRYFPNLNQEIGNAYHWNSSGTTLKGASEKEYFLEHYLFKDPDDTGGLIGFALDITPTKESEKELIAAKQNAEKAARARQKFLSTMSHEIRTPLNAIIGMTHLLLQDKLTEQQMKRLNILKFSGENLLNTLNDILDFSKIESGGIDFAKSDFNLIDLIKNTHESFVNLADKKGIRLEINTGESLPLYIKGDSHRLQQVLNNLLNNAIKFTQEGAVTLEVQQETESDERHSIVFRVKDTGIGIAPEKIESIFQPFKQAEADTSRKYGGTGLGLAIIKNIVEQQGGKIEVESIEGEGSVFNVSLSFEKSSLTHELEPLEEKLVSLRGGKVLYVEDVAVNQLLLEGFCNLWNVELDVVSSGREALEQVRKRRYDLILMDIQMPEMDGYETTRKIRTIQGDYYNKIPIVALSAEVSEDIKTKIYKSGMNGYLTKPIVPSELHATIQKHVPDNTINSFVPEKAEVSVASENYEKIDFETLDKLFSMQQQEYIGFLDNILNDFSKNFRDIRNGIKEKDGKTFSDARHKLLSILKIMKTQQVLGVLDQIKGDFDSGLLIKEDNIINKVNLAYDCLVDSISKKIEGLKSNQN
jgi:PAS domain S-box-containing protein